MPGEAQIIRLLPLLVRLFPEIVESTFYRGSASVLSNVKPEEEQNLNRALNAKTRIKKQPNFNDETAVIKVSAAIKCVEDKFNNTALLKEFFLRAVKQVYDDILGRKGPLKTAAQDIADRMAACIRENSLRQDTPRVAKRSTTHGRPAKGHGRGRRTL